MSDDILFLIGFLFVVLLAFTFSHSGTPAQNVGILGNISSNPSGSVYTTSPVSVSKNSAPTISYFSQSAGPVGMSTTVYGTGFLKSNTVHFGATNVFASSDDGTTLVFKVPSLPVQTCVGNSQNCVIPAQNTQTNLGTYQVFVSNTNGQSNNLSFTIGDYGTNYGLSRPQITNVVGPQKLLPNDSGVWSITVSVSNPTTLIVSADWGDANVSNNGGSGTRRISISKTQTIALSHSYHTLGSYNINFNVIDDDSSLATSYTQPVTVVYAPPVDVSQLKISYLSQGYGPAGTQIAIIGGGFSASPVTIHFGSTALRATPQNYGTALYFNVPANTPVGSYQIYVSNDLGQITDTNYFSVTNP